MARRAASRNCIALSTRIQRPAAPPARKVKGTIHWVSAGHAFPAEVRLYDRLFTVEQPDADPSGRDFKEFLNPNSLELLAQAKLEPSLAQAKPGTPFQLERIGYFCADTRDSRPGKPVFNRVVTFKDSWSKEAGK